MTPPDSNRPTSAPSIFLSYASEDRAAVRLLRDALSAAGLDVWYDENELTGGDAWDRKIRRQIRECTYFMPIISATTNARAEGYFRREWRMGVERTQDMADDVIYLLPVTIDDVDESTARVPEQFLNVQWLRAPGGQPTPALNDLCHRLLTGGSHQMHKPASTATRATTTRSVPPPPATAAATAKNDAKEDEDLAPPAGKEWWFWLRRVWRKLPRWVRFCLWGVFVISALNTCTRCSTRDDPQTRSRKAAAVADAITKNQTSGNFDVAAVKKSVQDALKAAAEARANGKAQTGPVDVDLLPFTGGDLASKVFTDLYGKLSSTSGLKHHLSPIALKGTPGDMTPVERAKADGARFVLSGGIIEKDGGADLFRATLQRVSDGETLWTQDFSEDETPAAISAQVFVVVVPLILKKD